jgi:hypothetical protein
MSWDMIENCKNGYNLPCAKYQRDGQIVKVVTWRNTEGRNVSAVEDDDGNLSHQVDGSDHGKVLAQI